MNPVLESTKFVVENSRLVKINPEQLDQLAVHFHHGKAKHWLAASPFDFSTIADPDRKLHLVFLFNVLSFCYWGEPKWTVEIAGENYDGAWGMIMALTRAIDRGLPVLDFGFCAQLKKVELADILRGNIEIPLLDQRVGIINEVGEQMLKKYQGRLKNLIAEADRDALKVVELILENFPSFADRSEYLGKEVYFSKRAQLFVADCFQIFNGVGYGDFKNADQLTACADYKLPQLLRKTGILEYQPELAEKIDGKVELEHGSVAEIEIRANTIWAIEEIRKKVLPHNPEIKSFEINDHIWLATQTKYPDDKPYHRTRTTAY